jgi:hypothetical protein
MARKPATAKRVSRTTVPQRGKDGVDLTLILWMLSLTPAQRLLQDNACSIMRLRAKRKRTEA